jgi:hypothetical protein
MARYRGGHWEYQLAPALEGEALGGAAVGPDGTLYVAGEHHALYINKGDTWTIHRYGSTGTAVMECAIAKDGTLLLVGRHGRVLSYDGSAFKDVSIQGLSAGSLAHKWVDSWMDRKRMTLWIVASKMLIELDLDAKTARMHSSKLFFDLQAIAGADTPSGPLIMVGSFSATALFDGSEFFQADDSGANSLFIDVKRAQAYATDHSSVRAIDLAHPFLGTGPGQKVTR